MGSTRKNDGYRSALFVGAVLAIPLLIFPFVASAEEDLPAFENKQAKLVTDLEAQQGRIREVSARLDELTQTVSGLKARLKKSGSLLVGYRLESSLKEAKQITDELDRLTRQANNTRAEIRSARAELAAALDRAIEENGRRAGQASLGRADRRRAAQEVERLSYRRMQLVLLPLTPSFPAPVGGLQISGGTPEDLKERLNVVRDFERRMTRELEAVNAELTQARRQRFVRTELSHLLEEESFFGEQAFMRGGPVRSKNDPAMATALSRPSATSPGTAAGSGNTTAATTTASGTSASSTSSTSSAVSSNSAPSSSTAGGSSSSTSAGAAASSAQASAGSTTSSASTSQKADNSGSAAAPVNGPVNAGGTSANAALPVSIPDSAGKSTDTAGIAAADSSAVAAPETNARLGLTTNGLANARTNGQTAPETAQDRSEPEALYQLARAFGVPVRDNRESSGEGLSAPDGQISRLEHRLRMTQEIVARLREIAKGLEQHIAR
jgi:hypothetical protein